MEKQRQRQEEGNNRRKQTEKMVKKQLNTFIDRQLYDKASKLILQNERNWRSIENNGLNNASTEMTMEIEIHYNMILKKILMLTVPMVYCIVYYNGNLVVTGKIKMIYKHAAIVQNSLRMKELFENDFLNECMNTILHDINEKSKSDGTKGIDTIMDDVIGEHGSDGKSKATNVKSNSRSEVILNTLVSVSNDVLQNCFKGNIDELGREARKQKTDDDDVNNRITLSHIENRSDVIDVDENELRATVQNRTQQQSDGGMNNNASKSSLEAYLSNRCIIGCQPIINDCNNKRIINENSIFYFRFLGGMLNIKHSVEKIEELHKANEHAAINNARAPPSVGSMYFESMGPDT